MTKTIADHLILVCFHYGLSLGPLDSSSKKLEAGHYPSISLYVFCDIGKNALKRSFKFDAGRLRYDEKKGFFCPIVSDESGRSKKKRPRVKCLGKGQFHQRFKLFLSGFDCGILFCRQRENLPSYGGQKYSVPEELLQALQRSAGKDANEIRIFYSQMAGR